MSVGIAGKCVLEPENEPESTQAIHVSAVDRRAGHGIHRDDSGVLRG
jgi:hypothetical protein